MYFQKNANFPFTALIVAVAGLLLQDINIYAPHASKNSQT